MNSSILITVHLCEAHKCYRPDGLEIECTWSDADTFTREPFLSKFKNARCEICNGLEPRYYFDISIKLYDSGIDPDEDRAWLTENE